MMIDRNCVRGRGVAEADRVAEVLRLYRLSFGTERQVQNAIESALCANGIDARREQRLAGTTDRIDRIDFVTDDGVGIEVKCNGPLPALTRQVYRYLGYDELCAIVVVVTRVHLAALPRTLRSKPVRVVMLPGGIG